MRAFWCAAFTAGTSLVQGATVEAHSSLTFDTEAAKNRPVSKVVNLLKDMLKPLEKEAEEDEEIYDQLVCWCTTNDKEKTKAIADAEARIDDLTSMIEELTATSARLNTEIANLDKEVKKNQEALESATKQREKQMKEFNAEEADMLNSIDLLGGAVEALSKMGGASFMQSSLSQKQSMANLLTSQLTQHADILEGSLMPSERRTVSDFLETVDQARP